MTPWIQIWKALSTSWVPLWLFIALQKREGDCDNRVPRYNNTKREDETHGTPPFFLLSRPQPLSPQVAPSWNGETWPVDTAPLSESQALSDSASHIWFLLKDCWGIHGLKDIIHVSSANHWEEEVASSLACHNRMPGLNSCHCLRPSAFCACVSWEIVGDGSSTWRPWPSPNPIPSVCCLSIYLPFK